TLADATTFAVLHRWVHEAPAIPALLVFDDRYTTSPRDLAPRDAHAQLPLSTEELVRAVGTLLRRADYPTHGIEPEPEPESQAPPEREVVDLAAARPALLPHPSGVRLLSGPADPTLVELIPPLLPARLVEVCKTLAELVIVDTAPTLDDLTLHVLDVADRVLV